MQTNKQQNISLLHFQHFLLNKNARKRILLRQGLKYTKGRNRLLKRSFCFICFCHLRSAAKDIVGAFELADIIYDVGSPDTRPPWELRSDQMWLALCLTWDYSLFQRITLPWIIMNWMNKQLYPQTFQYLYIQVPTVHWCISIGTKISISGWYAKDTRLRHFLSWVSKYSYHFHWRC